MPSYPPDSSLLVRVGRFLNILDDGFNALSPVKINLWGANLAAYAAGAGTILTWLSGHLSSGVADLWAPLGGWLTQAHVTHHFDKRERNKQNERMAAIGAGDGK